MGKIFSLVLAFALSLTLWANFAPTAQADLSNLTPCGESAAFQAKAKNFRNTTDDPQSGQKRAQSYAKALCGPEGYPHLVVDGRLSHAGDFIIPGVLFLYIAGWIGWVGRSYLIAIREEKDTEMREIIIDVPLAISKMLFGFVWPLQALQELSSGKLTVKDSEITVSPR
jgi:photosystem I subunit III